MFHIYHPSIFCKKSESSIRHEVRKLRAKVRTLIPQQGCQHYQKRNNKIEKFQQRKSLTSFAQSRFDSQVQQFQRKGIWKFGLLQKQQWYTEAEKDIAINKLKINNECQFHKLKESEIKEINEDKVYYLGQKNIDTYNNFLKTIKSNINLSKKTKEIKYKKQNKVFVNLSNHQNNIINIDEQLQISNRSKFEYSSHLVKSSPILKNYYYIPKNRSAQKHQYSSQKQLITKDNTKSHETFYHPQQVNNRKQQVQQQQKKWQLQHKLRMDIQMAKVQANKKQIKYLQNTKIKANQHIEKQKYDKLMKKKNVLIRRGEIIKLDQQLRTIMIKRKNNKNFENNHQCIHDTSKQQF